MYRMDPTTLQRFQQKINRSPDGCWLWTGSKDSKGYAKMKFGKSIVGSHRLAYRHWKGDIPEGQEVRHMCKNKCVNPDHLELGTHSQNIRDKIRDGTYQYGEQNPSALITEEQVITIRILALFYRNYEVSKMIGMTDNCVSQLVLRRRWSHV